MKSVFVFLTVALVCSTLAEGFLFRKVSNRINERRELQRASELQKESEEAGNLPEGELGTRLYDALMELSGSNYLANTFFRLGNYINNADYDNSRTVSGEAKLDLTRFSPEKRKEIEETLEDLKVTIKNLNEGFNQILIPSVQNAQSIFDLPKVFTNQEFQAKRRPFLKNVGKLALLGVSPYEILPNGMPALFKILGGLKADLENLTVGKVSKLIPTLGLF